MAESYKITKEEKFIEKKPKEEIQIHEEVLRIDRHKLFNENIRPSKESAKS